VLGPDTAVLSLQNGVDNEDRIDAQLGAGRAMGGVAQVFATIESPGVIRHHAAGRIIFGELDGRVSERGQRLRDLCEAAGFEGVLSTDIMVPVWQKFLLLVPLSGLNALTRLPLGKWREDPDLVNLYEAALRETVAVGLAEGVRLPPDSADKTLAMMRSMPSHHTTSMGNDLLRGNRLELPWFAGKVVELGRRHGIPTPVNGFIYAALKPYVNGPPV